MDRLPHPHRHSPRPRPSPVRRFATARRAGGFAFFLVALFLFGFQSARGAFWPFGAAGDAPARLHWNDGDTSDVLLAGFRYETPPVASAGAPASLSADLDRGGRKLLTPRVRPREDAAPFLVPPLRLDSISFAPLETRIYGSDTSARWFSLGTPEQRIPPPPDWYSTWEDSPLWRPARLAPVDPTWTYLAGAAWLWTSSDLQPAQGERVLFRQRFVLPKDQVILRAVLWLEADSVLGDCYVNGRPLPWQPQVLGGKTARASVERLLRPGENLIAVDATAPRSGEIDAAGMAWHLSLALTPNPPSRPGDIPLDARVRAHAFSVRTLDGGWVPAARVDLDLQRVEIVRPTGGKLLLDRSAVRWIEHWPPDFRAVAPVLPNEDIPSPAINGTYDEFAETEGLWTLSGAFHRGHLAEWSPEPAEFTVRDSAPDSQRGDAEPAPKAADTVRAVLTSPSAGELRWDIPSVDLARQVRVLLRDGTHLTGLLEPSSGDRIVLNLPGETRATFKASEAVELDFPAMPSLRARTSFRRLAGGSKDVEIGLIGEVPCRGGLGCPESVVPPLQRITQALGAGTHWFKPQELLLPEYFTPQRFPVLFNLDSSESYYHTIQRPGDGHQALQNYMNQGGILIHLAPGTPFFYGRQAHARQWALVPLGGGLNRAFGMTVSGPGAGAGGALFEVPDNSAEPLEFVRVAEGPWAEGLPATTLFPCIGDSRFRPVAPDAQRAGATLIPLYRLTRGSADFGLAAAAVRVPSVSTDRPFSYSVYIAWPLAQARDAFGESLLPQLIPAILDAIAKDSGRKQP